MSRMNPLPLVRDLLALPEVSVSFWGDDHVQQKYRDFVKPHPRFKLIQNKRWGAALLVLPDDPQTFLKGKEKALVRSKRNKAIKQGYTVRAISALDHLNAIIAINRSTPERQGNAMLPSYVEPELVEAYHRKSTTAYGLFNAENELRAYADVPILGDFFLFSRILGHADDLSIGVMYLLVSEVILAMCEQKQRDGFPSWAMYDTYYGNNEGLRFFKHQMGFAPYKVRWTWQERAIEPSLEARAN